MDLEDRLGRIDSLEVLEGCSHDPLDRRTRVKLGACRRRRIQDCQKDLLDRGPEDRGLFRRYCRSPNEDRPWGVVVCSSRKGPRSLEGPVLHGENEVEAEQEDRGRGEGEQVVGDRHAEGLHEQGQALWQAVGQM